MFCGLLGLPEAASTLSIGRTRTSLNPSWAQFTPGRMEFLSCNSPLPLPAAMLLLEKLFKDAVVAPLKVG